MNAKWPERKRLFTEQVEKIFCSAVELESPAARDAFLLEACSGDLELQAKVRALIAAHVDAGKLFAEIRTDATESGQAQSGKTSSSVGKSEQWPSETAAAGDEQLGSRIGPYRLVEVLGHGGCGMVYMAEQETPVRRQVALKVIKLGMDTKCVIARFDAERQALAMMDHPNIAHVLDAGATETGRPYFVMELVRGTRITRYCDENRLDVAGRLRLVVQVCHALQHAHQKGIVHRDIKPSNILVTMHDGAAMPMVIDFGISKAVEGRLTDKTMFTPHEQFIGTPAYMSPEQAQRSRLDVDTRSDIYSLGVLLYELLTGRPPFQTHELLDLGVDEMRRTLREKEPMRPSLTLKTMSVEARSEVAKLRQVDPTKLWSALQGDLDWIITKALEKDRNRRYQTVNDLAADVQRYLNSEPVTARPPSRIYRLGKLIRRNKVVFASALAVALALAAGLATTTIMLLRERQLREEQARLRIAAERGLAVEAKLRKEAEWREGIRQATTLVYQKAYGEADRLVDQLPSEPATMEGAAMLRILGEWNALRGEWTAAEKRYQSLLRANRFDAVDSASLDLMATAVSMIKAGDLAGYQAFCREVVVSAQGTADPMVADRVLKSSLLLPANRELLQKLKPFAHVVEVHTQHTDYASADENASWRCQTLALWRYREGDYAGAITWSRRAQAAGDRPMCRSASSRVISAVSFHRLQQQADANAEFEHARRAIRSRLKRPLTSYELDGGFWFDLIICEILLNEATALIEAPSVGSS